VTLVALAQLGRGVVPVDEPVLYVDDEGVLRGRAVFETLRVYNGVPFKLEVNAKADAGGLADAFNRARA